MSTVWTVYLVLGFGLAALVVLLVRELDPKNRPDSSYRALDSLAVVLGVATVISLLIEFGVLAASL